MRSKTTVAVNLLVQAQILNLLLDVQADQNLIYLFISHDLAVLRPMSDRVAVMAGGKVVEQGPVDQVLKRPTQPYTRELIEAVPCLSRTLN